MNFSAPIFELTEAITKLAVNVGSLNKIKNDKLVVFCSNDYIFNRFDLTIIQIINAYRSTISKYKQHNQMVLYKFY